MGSPQYPHRPPQPQASYPQAPHPQYRPGGPYPQYPPQGRPYPPYSSYPPPPRSFWLRQADAAIEREILFPLRNAPPPRFAQYISPSMGA